MNFTKWRVSTKSCAPLQDIEEVRRNFLCELIETVEFNKTPPHSIGITLEYCWFQVPSGQWIKRVEKGFHLLATMTRGKSQLCIQIPIQRVELVKNMSILIKSFITSSCTTTLQSTTDPFVVIINDRTLY